MSQETIQAQIAARTIQRNRGFMAKAGQFGTQARPTQEEAAAMESARNAKILEARRNGKPLYQAVTVTFSDGTMATYFGKAKVFEGDGKAVKGWSFTEPSTMPYPYCGGGQA